MLTFSPRLSSKHPIEAAARPLPNEDTTPPVTKMYFAAILASVRLNFLEVCTETRSLWPSGSQRRTNRGAQPIMPYLRQPRQRIAAGYLSNSPPLQYPRMMSADRIVPPIAESAFRNKYARTWIVSGAVCAIAGVALGPRFNPSRN